MPCRTGLFGCHSNHLHFLEAAPVCASPGFPPSLTSVWPGSWASGSPSTQHPRYPLSQGPPGPPSCEQPPMAALLGERSPNTFPRCPARRAKFVFPSLAVGIFPAQVFIPCSALLKIRIPRGELSNTPLLNLSNLSDQIFTAPQHDSSSSHLWALAQGVHSTWSPHLFKSHYCLSPSWRCRPPG